jgi:tRNA A37 threonylcarbamoyladenosine synthetase subunit TsaC/SUA5/YrdC
MADRVLNLEATAQVAQARSRAAMQPLVAHSAPAANLLKSVGARPREGSLQQAANLTPGAIRQPRHYLKRAS